METINSVPQDDRDSVSKKDSRKTWVEDLLTDRSLKLSKLEARKVASLLEDFGYNLDFPGLKDTPARVSKWLNEFLIQPTPKVTVFPNIEGYNNMVISSKIPFYSLCEHHFLPFFGEVDVAYIPSTSIIGLSKIPRLVQFLAAEPQTQEDLTEKIKATLQVILSIEDVAVKCTARHLCMEMRGVEVPGTKTITAGLGGEFEKPEVRAEFYSLLR